MNDGVGSSFWHETYEIATANSWRSSIDAFRWI